MNLKINQNPSNPIPTPNGLGIFQLSVSSLVVALHVSFSSLVFKIGRDMMGRKSLI